MNTVLYLNWPEVCYRANEADVAHLASLLPGDAHLTVVRDDAGLLAALPAATHVLTWHFREAWFARAPHLKVLATPAAGHELLPKKVPEGVTLHFGGFHGAIISEAVLAFALAWKHGFFHRTLQPLWPRANLAPFCGDMAGTNAVILGYGRIGRAIAKRFVAYGVNVRGFSHTECDVLRTHLNTYCNKCLGGRLDHEDMGNTYCNKCFDGRLGREDVTNTYCNKCFGDSFKNLCASLAGADWLVTALPSDTGTDDFINADLLALVPSRCVFVNVGRGNAVDETALVEALRTHRLAGAYLDVYRNEPTLIQPKLPPPGFDIANAAAEDLPPTLIRMPHSSAYSPSYLRCFFQELKDEGLI